MLIRLQSLLLSAVIISSDSLSYADTKSAFDFFKSLKGIWTIHENGKILPIKMTYDLGSRDSVITEQFGKELSVFYTDKTDLLMTHFCNRGNQPRLKYAPMQTANFYEFKLVDITNLANEGDPHVQSISYKIVDQNQIALELTWKLGSVYKSEKYTLTKQQSN